MRGVGGADVDRVDCSVPEQLAIIVDYGLYTETSCEPFCRCKFATGDPSHVEKFHSPQCLQMHAAHESSSGDCGSNPFHSNPCRRTRRPLTPTRLRLAAL